MSRFLDGPENDCGQPARESEIPRTLARLFGEIERYENALCRIADKLAPVVVPSLPPGTKELKDAKAEGFHTPLANEINSANCRLRNLTEGLESLCQRIEL